MAELESVIEKRLIDQLCSEESQWTYRPDIHTEEQLWANFKYILEQNNKAKLNDTPLSTSEFAKIKNDVSHQSFYDAAKWLVGENGKVYVHVQRGNEILHLMVLNNEHISGGTTTYEVINQYQLFKDEENVKSRDRRFDVTLLINGIPLIHIELKNKDHAYMDGFYQIQKYIGEGAFRGLFSNVQMFVISNAVDTKYFSAARSTELKKEFLTGWVDNKNNPVPDYIDFADVVLRIPLAHEMVTHYTVLDNDKKRMLILRPYQIHAIRAMRDASKRGISGYIWHTTGSGKTMTSYKATRNLLMDIPSIDKTVFLIDRKDLDKQTKMAFQSYADNDTVDVDETEYVDMLIKKLGDGNRQMIVTTRQKMQTMISKKLVEGNTKYEKAYNKIKQLKIAFVVDECHRAVTPQTKRDIEGFFRNSLWYGFTGTPIFEVNSYEQKGDLAQTTEQLYGKCLHSYTIKEAIHDKAVLGFMVENLGPKGIPESEEESYYNSRKHMRNVLDVILNKSQMKLGLNNSRGQAYEALLTVPSIAKAQEYYELLKNVKEGNDELKISEEVKQMLPDFPKFAITYSLSENEEVSAVNQEKMRVSLIDYNEMFGTHYGLEGINAYNGNLNDRLARKEKKYMSRDQQLDLVIVVDRLLTGFDAPCLSTLYIDRPPMTPQNLIQAFSRTNRLFDAGKTFGQIVTFRYPDEYKDAINEALRIYSRGGDGNPISEDWDTIKKLFEVSLKALRNLVPTPSDVAGLSKKEKKVFIHLFRDLDKAFAHLKAFSSYTDEVIIEYGFSEEEYTDYAAMYKNVMEELKDSSGDDDDDYGDDPIGDDYDLIAVNKIRIDFEYIVELLQGLVDSLVTPADPDDKELSEIQFEREFRVLRELIMDFYNDNEKLSNLLSAIMDEIEADREKYIGQDMFVVINRMRYEAIDREVLAFSEKWFIDPENVKYEVINNKDGKLANENKFKENADYTRYKESSENPLPKFRFYKELKKAFEEELIPEVTPLL